MSNNAVRLGFFGLSLGLAAGAAEAKLIRYEINGQTYSYSTNNIQQTREARRRIEAAAAASAAKARAQAEAAGNPLARMFGSPSQRQAAEAEARLQQVLTTRARGEVETTSSIERPGARMMAAPRARARQEAVVQEAPGRERTQRVREARVEPAPEARVRRSERPAPASAGRSAAATPEAAPPAPPPTQLIAPIERARPAQASPTLAFRERLVLPDTGSLTDFVNQVRKAPADAPKF